MLCGINYLIKGKMSTFEVRVLLNIEMWHFIGTDKKKGELYELDIKGLLI